MKSNKFLNARIRVLAVLIAVFFVTELAFAGGKAGNSIPITVNGRRSLASGEPNMPYVSVTICNPTSTSKKACQTINNILLDTGSEGLRIFNQVISQGILIGSDAIGECMSFEDGTSLWGTTTPVDVILGSEKAKNIRMQLIANSYPGGGTPSSPNPIQVADCPGAIWDPTTAGFNGILGVSTSIQDSGDYWDNTPTCCPGNPPFLNNPITPSSNFIVSNPVAFFPTDNNGIIVQLPAIPQGGAGSATGTLVFGIGTQTNNVPPSSVVVFPADSSGDISTNINGSLVPSTFDTGTNALLFPDPLNTIPLCSDPDWFCPTSFQALSAMNLGTGGSPSAAVTFEIGNHDTLTSSGNMVFNNIGGPQSDEVLWGLPFFFGRSIFLGINGQTSTLGTGPFFAL